jgi:hypothetical protein
MAAANCSPAVACRRPKYVDDYREIAQILLVADVKTCVTKIQSGLFCVSDWLSCSEGGGSRTTVHADRTNFVLAKQQNLLNPLF